MRSERARQALGQLMEGNGRFVESRFEHPRQDLERRERILPAQEPAAVVLGCSDSRVPPEILFDQGLGDLFVIRVAGNILDPSIVESVEYAVAHLDVPLVLVLGHSSCGAVTAVAHDPELVERPSRISQFIGPAVDDARNQAEDVIESAGRSNCRRVASDLASTPGVLASRVDAGALDVVPAYYDLSTGKVELI